MPGNDDGKCRGHAASTGSSTVSPSRFAELEALVANLAALVRDSLAHDTQGSNGTTTSEPRAPALGAAAKRSPPEDPPPALVTFARPLPSDGDYLTWEDWAPLIAPGFAIQPAPGMSATPDFYDIAADETSRILMTEKRQ
eukprot:jgi/Tetstr1/436982/TSEL_025754.t1